MDRDASNDVMHAYIAPQAPILDAEHRPAPPPAPTQQTPPPQNPAQPNKELLSIYVTPKDLAMRLDHDINASARWLNECNIRIDGAGLDDNDRNRVAACLLHLAMEHHGSILILACSNPPHYGSALALLRPQFECYVRAIWVHRCANEQEINRFAMKDKLPGIDDLIKKIEALPGFEGGLLSDTKKKIWGTMCGLTHGGSTQVASRSCATEIASGYTDEQIRGMLRWACSTTLSVATSFANLLDNNVMGNELLSMYREIFPNDE